MQTELPKIELPKAELPLPPRSSEQDASSSSERAMSQAQTPKNMEASMEGIGSVGAEAGLSSFNDALQQPQTAVADSTEVPDVGTTTANPIEPLISNNQVSTPSKSLVVPEAADKDEIEKVWVDKAKKIVNQTKGDPFMQERAVSRLQADYMKKRFDKEVKLPKESQ